MKKILITGGAGFIGSNLIDRLLKEGNEVHSLDNYDSGTEENHVEGCNYVRGDIESIIDWDGTDFDLVFHLAGLSRIQPSFENPNDTFRVNTVGTKFVLDWAKQFKVKVIYSGSSSRWHNPFQSPYACFKHMGEELCKLYRKCYDVDVEIVRFYNVYGPNEIIDGDWAAVIGMWRRQVRDGLPITIVGDGEQRRDFTHVDDIIDGLYKISVSNEKHEDAWELGTGTNYSINQVYNMFEEKFGVSKIHLPNQHGNYRETLRENNDVLDRLGWEPKDRLKNYIQNL
jgi:UDP-glucose 4-epimerase